MKTLTFKKGARAIALVAHPDDETIWMGGFIYKHPVLQWTIFSLCRASDRDRAPKFRRVCQFYQAKCLMADLEDEGRMNLSASVPAIKKLVREKLKGEKFDYLFTHGANGEYGHERHKGVHLAAQEMLAARELSSNRVFFFNYTRADNKKSSRLVSGPSPDLIVKLGKNEFIKKTKVMTDIYGFSPDGIDVGYCTNPEAFKMGTI